MVKNEQKQTIEEPAKSHVISAFCAKTVVQNVNLIWTLLVVDYLAHSANHIYTSIDYLA